MVEVTLLTQENCLFCEQAKEILARLAGEYELSVSTLDLGSKEGRDMAVRGGVMFPPCIFVDGRPFAYGRPSERALRREIETRIPLKESRNRTVAKEEDL